MPPKVSRNRLAPVLDALATCEGPNATPDRRVIVYRVSASEPPTPTLYAASLIFVGQGSKRGLLAGETYEYDAEHCLLVASPLPMLCGVAVRGEPVLTAAVAIDLEALEDLVSSLDPRESRRAQEVSARGVHLAPLDPPLEEAMCRLLRQLREPETARVLAPATIREVYFHFLRGPCGAALQGLASQDDPIRQMDRVMRHMTKHFAEPMAIEALARLARMSVPTFHQHFKKVTSTSPLQYLKAVRLTRARLLMLQQGVSAKVAAHEVGYSSESQFSREFRRFFGAPPAASVATERLRSTP